jgi:hypothetical protein
MKIYRVLMVGVTIALVLPPMVWPAQVEQGWGEGGAMDRGRMGGRGWRGVRWAPTARPWGRC